MGNFIGRVFTQEDYNKQHWKEQFIDGLPSFISERVYSSLNKAYSYKVPWEDMTYGQITTIIIECSLDICNEIKVQNKVQKQADLHKMEMKTFCSQYGYEKLEEPNSSKKKIKRKTYQEPYRAMRYCRKKIS